MGQQQILFVILTVCIIAIAISVGVLSMTGGEMTDNRFQVAQDLDQFAKKTQDYVNLPIDQGGGGISFYVLSRLPDALSRVGVASSNSHGDFFIKKTESASSLQIIGVGIEAGNDQKHPLRMVVTVWKDSSVLSILN